MTQKSIIADRTYIWFAAVVATAALFYYKSLCPGVYYIDSGELAVNCYVLGIPHPTGYPLYVLLGRLFTMILPVSPISAVNLLSLLAAAFSSGIIYLIIKTIIKADTYKHLISISAALFAAFLPVWWSQGTSNEVYCLTLMSNLLVIYLAVRYNIEKNIRLFLVAIYIWVLSLGFHLGSLFLAPALVYLYISQNGINLPNRKLLIAALLLSIIGISIYLYLPIRAAYKPFLNWGNPTSLFRFYSHITGWQYQVWMFNSFDKMFNGIALYVKTAYANFGLIGILPIPLGFVWLWRKSNALAVFTMLILAINLFYSANYDIADIESYYLPGFIILAIYFGLGLAEVIGFLTKMSFAGIQKYAITIFIIMLLIGLPFSNLVSHYNKQDQSDNILPKKFVEMILNSMADNSIALVENWDIYSPWLYANFVEKHDRNKILIDKELLRRSWYIDFIMRTYPEITSGAKNEMLSFKRLVKPFEQKESFNPDSLTIAYRTMIGAIIESNFANRNIYTNIARDPDIITKKYRIPIGAMYKFIDKPEIGEIDYAQFEIVPFSPSFSKLDRRSAIIASSFLRVFKHRRQYLESLRDTSELNALNNTIAGFEKILSKQ